MAANPAGDAFTGDGVRSGQLAWSVLSARHVTIMAVAATGPAAVIALSYGPMASFAGPAFVLSSVIVLVAILLLANTFVRFSRRYPSAGSLYTWGVKAFGQHFGFVPWLDRTAAVLCDYEFPEGRPIEVAPLRVLRRVVDRASALGLDAHLGPELESSLLREVGETIRQKEYKNPTPLFSRPSGYGLTAALWTSTSSVRCVSISPLSVSRWRVRIQRVPAGSTRSVHGEGVAAGIRVELPSALIAMEYRGGE
jgi:amino acid transporter